VILAAAGEAAAWLPPPQKPRPLAGTPLFLHSLLTFAGLSFVREIAIVSPRNGSTASETAGTPPGKP